jgi:sugar phosphate isomerase/epimerase
MNNKPVSASLSTMWAIKNFPNLNIFFDVAGKLGFEKVELNHQVDSSMLKNIDFDHHQFSSVHEPCPADIPTKELVKNDWLISSTDKDSRKRGVASIKKSIRLANELNAPVVVVHCGNVSADQKLERELRDIFPRSDADKERYQALKLLNQQARDGLAQPRLNAVKESLKELVDFASSLEIKLGLENRYHFMDIPSIDEMDQLLSLADDKFIGFVYDVGHAQALDRLGFFPHEEWLSRFSGRMIGAHLHDVKGLTDHLAPGLGEIDFGKCSAYLHPEAFRTCELLPGNTLAQVMQGISILIEAGCVRYKEL